MYLDTSRRRLEQIEEDPELLENERLMARADASDWLELLQLSLARLQLCPRLLLTIEFTITSRLDGLRLPYRLIPQIVLRIFLASLRLLELLLSDLPVSLVNLLPADQASLEQLIA